MGWGPAPQQVLIIPSDATDTEARTIIGGPEFLPADLVAKYAALNTPIVSGQVTWAAGNPINANYTYAVTVIPTGGPPRPIQAFGSRDGASLVVQEAESIVGGAFPVSTVNVRDRLFVGGSVALSLDAFTGGPLPDFTIQGIGQGRGIVAGTFAASVSDSAAISTGTALCLRKRVVP